MSKIVWSNRASYELENNDYIFYRAFSEVSDGTKLVPTYGFVKELK